MSALPPKADICSAQTHVRFVPIADIAHWRSREALLRANFQELEEASRVERTMTLSRILATILVAAVIAILGAVTFVSMGGYDVAATQQDSGLMRWLLHTTMQRSVSQRAKSVQVPAQFTEEQRREGAIDFSEMCVGCHGAPAEERGEIGKGLNPSPPNLAKVIPNWSSAEVFWILKNGIRMTGMPAFGPTHSDARLWSIVAFVMQLPKMTSDDYKKMRPSPREHEHQREDGHDHQH